MKFAIKPFQLNTGGLEEDKARLAILEQGNLIPKVIHQAHHSKPWNSLLEDNVSALKSINSDWKHNFYSNSDQRSYIGDVYGREILRYFDAISPSYPAARADLFRYLLMYREGGVYLDIKSGTSKRLTDTVDPACQYVLSTWPNRRGDQYDMWGLHPELTRRGLEEYQQWHIICAPGHPFLRAVILNVLRNIRIYNPFFNGTARKAVLNITGPIAYTLAVEPLVGDAAHVRQSVEDLGIYYSIFDREGLGNEAHLGATHYSRMIGHPVVQDRSMITRAYRVVRGIAGR